MRIIKTLGIGEEFEYQDIKKERISASQLEKMKELSGSYEALFSKSAMKYKSLGLKDKMLSEEDYRKLILEEYTFLKRPVFIIDTTIVIGNSKNSVETVKNLLSK